MSVCLFVCLSVCSLSPPRSFDRSSPNLVGVCRWTSELPLRGSFSKRSTARRVNRSLSLSTILYICSLMKTVLQILNNIGEIYRTSSRAFPLFYLYMVGLTNLLAILDVHELPIWIGTFTFLPLIHSISKSKAATTRLTAHSHILLVLAPVLMMCRFREEHYLLLCLPWHRMAY